MDSLHLPVARNDSQYSICGKCRTARSDSCNRISGKQRGTEGGFVRTNTEKAVSEQNNTTTEETTLADNKQSNTWSLQSGDKRNQQIFYSSRKNLVDSYTLGKIWNDGDIAPVGANDLAFTVTYHDDNIGAACSNRNMPVAIDQFVLFDRSAIENVEFLKSTQGNQEGYTCSVLYAVRKSGRMDNDSMKAATLDDFEFTTEKPEGGCDGVLVQYRGTNLDGAAMDLRAQFTATVSQDAAIADKVYMITAFQKTWNASDLEDQILKETGKTDLSELSKKELSDAGKKLSPTELEGTKLVEKVPSSLPDIDNRNNYTVPRYENGTYMADADHKGNINSADGLYIVPYTTTVTKTVAQKDEDGNQMKLYNLSRKQQYVDYKIDSSIKYWADIEIPEGSTTTVYLEDTLPEGLTYIAGSANWGGNYSSKFPLAGKVNGGQQIEPTITTKEVTQKDGTKTTVTVLKWEIPNVTLKKGELPALYYSCKINKNVATNKSLENTVSIQTDEDKRPAFKELDNLSDTAVSITRDKEFYIDKRGGDSLELEDNSYYELIASNTTDEAKTDLLMIDTLPYAGDNKSTQFKGQYAITKLTMNADDVNHATDMELWYTDNEAYIGKTAKDIKASEITEANGWKKATATGHESDTITFTGDGLIGSWPTAIAYKDASLDNNTMAALRLEYKAVAGAKKDSFTNVWSTISNDEELKAWADTDIYDRTIEGTVWVDKNKDGKIDDNETKLEGVKVTLLVKNEKGEYIPYESYHETVNGTTEKSPYTVETDENAEDKNSKNSSSNTNSSSNSNSTTSSNAANTNKSAKTGDTNAVMPWMAACAVSVGAIFIMIGYRRRRSDK